MWTMQVDAQAYYSGSPADLLKGRQYTAGIRIFDIAHPEAPREIAFMATEGVGPHRIWYVGGRYAYVSIHYPEFTDQVLAIVDMAEPTPARGRRQVVDPRHVGGRRRDAELAEGSALRAAPRSRRR
jgi:hypothetical protein